MRALSTSNGHTLRLFVKCLAIVVGLVGLTWILVGPVTLVRLATGSAEPPMSDAVRTALRFTAGISVLLGWIVIRQCWIHLRRPERVTAQRVAVITSFILGFWMFYLATRYSLIPTSGGAWGAVAGFAVLVGVVVACQIFHRFVLKRLAERAFPSEA